MGLVAKEQRFSSCWFPNPGFEVHRIMPSVPIELLLRPLALLTIFHGGSSSHRLKHLEKGLRNPSRNWGSSYYSSFLLLLMESAYSPNAVHENSVSNLESTFNDSLHIQDAQKSEHASDVDNNYEVVEGLSEGFQQQQTKLSKKYLKKCATFPYSDKMLAPSSSDEEDEEADTSLKESLTEQSVHQTYSRSMSLPAVPTPLKLVSAMKGSREKQGGSRMKLTVKWAPDVYDPVPTSLCHTVKSKRQQKSRNKKNGKKGQKGNSSRGGSGKDKKPIRKIAVTPELCYKSLDSGDKVIEASTELDALDVSCQDSYCGTSFLKKSVTQMHYCVAEAL
ncbi:hypothetical protein L6164_033556 [Bauhinia variegata]|uniref:Uncharacterized protein n=1 Tax=Bauhinia variegata TaxID=167791 RepID=A0ACB9KS33_BAUVA|nr:hypothetical protein L6164_033556 [Bauhinia variegata]